jgi:hypothetical protein
MLYYNMGKGKYKKIDVLKKGELKVAIVVNDSKAYIGPDITYGEMKLLQERFTVFQIEDVEERLVKLTKRMELGL